MTDQEIDKRLSEIDSTLNSLYDERTRLNLVRGGLISTLEERTFQLVKVDEIVKEREKIEKEATPSVEDVAAILEGKK